MLIDYYRHYEPWVGEETCLDEGRSRNVFSNDHMI